MSIFSRVFKKKEEEDINAAPGADAAEQQAKDERPASAAIASESITAELTRIKAQLEAVAELRKAMNERFTQVAGQIGELRGMVLETGKSMQKVELSTTKAVGLVESIEPDKFFVTLHKQDAKSEALKASIESKEAMMQTIMAELKKMRQDMRVYRGLDQVVKMTEEVKAELTNIRKVKAVVERHADRVETFFTEIQKQVRGFAELESSIKDLKESHTKLSKTLDQVNVRLLQKANKKEVEALTANFKEFEDHTFRVIGLLNKEFTDVRTDFEHRFDIKFKRAERINLVLQDLIKPSPELQESLKRIKGLAEEEVKQKALEDARRKARQRPGLIKRVLKRGKKAEEAAAGGEGAAPAEGAREARSEGG